MLRASVSCRQVTFSVLLLASLGVTGACGVLDADDTEFENEHLGRVHSALSLSQPRTAHTATLLTDGNVLVAGGGATGFAEIVNQDGTSVETIGSLGTNRSNHTATLLYSSKVLVIGGQSGGCSLSSTEVYDPWTKSFAAGPAVAAARESHTTTLLKDGRLLIVGGLQNLSPNPKTYLNTSEIYDAQTGTISPTGSLATARGGHTTSLLPDGRVLVCGGKNLGAKRPLEADLVQQSAGAPEQGNPPQD